jgi:SnoaL-like domain
MRPGGATASCRAAHTSGVDELPAGVQGLLDAANDGDDERFLDSFTPDGVVDDWGRVFEGRARIAGWSEAEFIGKNVSLDVTAVSARGDDWTVAAQVGGDGSPASATSPSGSSTVAWPA